MVTPSSGDYHIVCCGSPTVRGNEGELRRLEAAGGGSLSTRVYTADDKAGRDCLSGD